MDLNNSDSSTTDTEHEMPQSHEDVCETDSSEAQSDDDGEKERLTQEEKVEFLNAILEEIEELHFCSFQDKFQTMIDKSSFLDKKTVELMKKLIQSGRGMNNQEVFPERQAQQKTGDSLGLFDPKKYGHGSSSTHPDEVSMKRGSRWGPCQYHQLIHKHRAAKRRMNSHTLQKNSFQKLRIDPITMPDSFREMMEKEEREDAEVTLELKCRDKEKARKLQENLDKHIDDMLKKQEKQQLENLVEELGIVVKESVNVNAYILYLCKILLKRVKKVEHQRSAGFAHEVRMLEENVREFEEMKELYTVLEKLKYK